MDLRLQPKPEVEILPADKGIVSRKQYFVKKEFEEINQYFFPAHFIRQWKAKAELIYPPVADETTIQYECDFNRNVQSCFVEDYAEEVYLRTPPPCFVIIGKFGKSVRELSEKLAKEYGSVLIRVDEIVNEVIKRQTNTSKILEQLLRLGVSLTLNFILALLSYAAHTAEARHRGYVLCGLPSPPLSYDLSPDQQLNYLFTWENRPTVFINVLFDDEDLIKERTSLFCEIKDVDSEKCILYHEEFQQDGDETEEESFDELMPIVEETFYEADINISPSRPWVQLPRDEECQVWSELEIFDNVLRPAIELIIARVDPQYFLTVDSRVQNELELVLARLEILQIWKAPAATPVFPPRKKSVENGEENNEIEENEKFLTESELDINRIIEEPPLSAFLTLFNTKTLSPKYKWELSHYNYICPVTLREGEIVEGKSEFAVIFMKYIYFLRDAECMTKFIQNPRAYVLPIRPKPLCRFFVLGYPFSGKTALAEALAKEFSIPIIDMKTVLRNDSERKKIIYQEFCQQKAECRETIRLTSLAWQDWRMEEEKRVNLIEEWLLYIQNILSQRIDQFYSAEEEEEGESIRETQVQSFTLGESSEGLGVETRTNENAGNRLPEMRGANVDAGTSNSRNRERFHNDNLASTSAKIIHAMKHEDFNFNEKCLEVEANLFFSSLWKSFSNEGQNFSLEKEINMDEDFTEFCYYGEGQFEMERYKSEESVTVDWCSLLPPQSLSTLLISKKPYTTREKRQSFKIFLDAASKAYWEPSALKSEFAKWRLPCFMDIPLCEIFLDNPILLLNYVPEWLKERPLIPDPINSNHPRVVEAGREAFFRAAVVTVKPNQEEMGILLRDAIEKAEREGMRVTGEVLSPGGWVVDNMTLDLKVWNKLACENVFADHIYILIDTEPDLRRIINLWWDSCGRFAESNQEILRGEDISNEEEEEKQAEIEKEEEEQAEIEKEEEEEQAEIEKEEKENFLNENKKTEDEKNVKDILLEAADAIAKGEEELDTIYNLLIKDTPNSKYYLSPLPVDLFCHDILKDIIETHCSVNEEANTEEALLTVQTLTKRQSYTANIPIFFYNHQISPSTYSSPLGYPLEVFTAAVLNYFKKKPEEEMNLFCNESLGNSLEFFLLLLTLPSKLEQLKEWLTAVQRDSTVLEIEMTDRSCEDIFTDIRKNLMEPFIKKPRELENFEMEEIQKFTFRPSTQNIPSDEEFKIEPLESETEIEDDLRIFGEAGPLCVVNLERDIYLIGKPEYALKYYGKLYLFWNQEAKNKFIENPEKYAPYYSAIRCYPPLRVFIVGPVGSGKTTLAQSLANQFSVAVVDYPHFLTETLVPYLVNTSKKFTALGNQKLLVAEEHNAPAKRAKQNFLGASYEKRIFWLESPFYSDIYSNKKILDKLIDLVQPVVPKSFPELTYLRVESVSEEEPNETNTNVSIPETPYVSMKDIETIISNYLENNSDLTDYCLEKSLKILWTKDPYITQGFILEGFPIRFSDIKHIINNNWIPDLVIEISLPEDEVILRNTDPLMDLWDTKLKQETVEEKLIEDTVIGIQHVFRAKRRNELMKAKREEAMQRENTKEEAGEKNKNSEDENQGENEFGKSSSNLKFLKTTIKNYEMKKTVSQESTLPDEVEAQIEVEVTEILNKEFPSLNFNSVFETYDAGKSRILRNLSDMYRRDVEEIEKIRLALKDLDISWLEVNGLKAPKEIFTDLFLRLDKVKKRSDVRGEFSFTMSVEMANKLLEQGYYFLSKFGRWCPVQVYKRKNPILMFRPFLSKGKITPIAYRNYIYFVAGENEKIKFMEDPIKYTFKDFHYPSIPLRIAVIGPPKSGKSTLCGRLAATFGLKTVTMGSALRFVLEKTPRSTLAKTITGHLRRGCFLSLSLKVEALLVCLNDPSCVTQGFIFDGIPFDAALTQSLAEKGKLPFLIISLVADPYFGKLNRQNLDLTKFRLPYKNRTNLDTRYKDWENTYKRFAQWNENTYNNLHEINAKLSVVDIFYQSYDIIRKSYFGILYYVENCVSNKVLPLHYMCVSQHEYELRKSSFHNNCPVCWSELNRLSSSTDPPPRTGLVQYLNCFYWICPKHMNKFIQNPKMYFPPHSPHCPELLPKRLNRSALEKDLPQFKIHGYGRCPVTRIDFPSNLDWEGSYDFAAFYDEEIYLCKNEEMLNRFLAQPWRYCNADTKFEVNRELKSNAVEQLGPPKITSLPPIGFLEQTVANLIHECLQILGAVRPVYPNMTPTATGCVFIALYLKVYNKENKTSHLERKYLDFMLEYCKAYRFQVSPLKPPQDRVEMGQGDYEPEADDKQDSSSEESTTSKSTAEPQHNKSLRATDKDRDADPYWLELESQVEKNMWSAKYLSEKFFEMNLTLNDELKEIPEVPKVQTILKYQTYGVRPNPLPPFPNCLTVIYSNKKDIHLPEKFNCNTLYQPLPSTVFPFSAAIMFNPDKQFSKTLYEHSKPDFPSKTALLKTKMSPEPSEEDYKIPTDPEVQLMIERFVPRFQVLDKIKALKIPVIPKVVEIEPMVFNPHRDYAYIMLFSEFFRTTHVLRCYEWDETRQHLEYSNRMDKNLGLTKVRVDYFHEPRRTASMKTSNSVQSYQRIFDMTTSFAVRSSVSEVNNKNFEQVSHDLGQTASQKSLVNFMQMLILEKLSEIFKQVSSSTLSYDSYEIGVVPLVNEKTDKNAIIIREVLPYPPLPWDIISRPYHAYLSISSIFQMPELDNIAHERHVSLLDGVSEPNDLQFVSCSLSDTQEKRQLAESKLVEKKTMTKGGKPIYFIYDFFNLPWSSFLTYPFSWAYNAEITYGFSDQS